MLESKSKIRGIILVQILSGFYQVLSIINSKKLTLASNIDEISKQIIISIFKFYNVPFIKL